MYPCRYPILHDLRSICSVHLLIISEGATQPHIKAVIQQSISSVPSSHLFQSTKSLIVNDPPSEGIHYLHKHNSKYGARKSLE